MPYVRIALMEAKAENRAEVQQMQEDLLRYDTSLPGFIDGYLLQDEDGSNRLGRLTMWNRKEDADHAAQQQHHLTVRSEMARLIQVGQTGHIEVGIDAVKV
ncbi:MAG: antibiotic biosynthesis monooxygenase [Dehalococcoidia bacterium]